MRIPVLRTAVVVASVAWTLLLVVVPFLASRPQASALGTALVVAAYSAASLICHQLPERSYRIWGAQMPVCARCAGIYVGASIASIVAGLGIGEPVRHSLTSGRAKAALGVAVAPAVVSLLYEWATGDVPANWIRAASGTPIGVAGAWLVVRHALAGRALALSPSGDEVN